MADKLSRGNVMVQFVDLGEGIDGDYDPDDPNNVELLRFDVLKKRRGEWEPIDDASYCTQVPASTPPATRQKLLKIIMDRVYDHASGIGSIKKICEELSWIEPKWADRTSSHRSRAGRTKRNRAKPSGLGGIQ